MSKPTGKFADFVREYCRWAESKPETETEEIKTAINLLANLYSNVLAIPNDNTGEYIDGNGISDEEWKKIFNRFGALPFNYYSEFLNPSNIFEEDPAIGDLADDLADIYRDLKGGLKLYEKGHITKAFHEWRQSFNIHWGRHASCALHALHAYAEDKGIEL